MNLMSNVCNCLVVIIVLFLMVNLCIVMWGFVLWVGVGGGFMGGRLMLGCVVVGNDGGVVLILWIDCLVFGMGICVCVKLVISSVVVMYLVC